MIYYLEEKKALLFNLNNDPDELENIFNNKPKVGQHLLALIQRKLRNANERISKID